MPNSPDNKWLSYYIRQEKLISFYSSLSSSLPKNNPDIKSTILSRQSRMVEKSLIAMICPFIDKNHPPPDGEG